MALRDINLVPAEVLERRYLIRHVVLWLSSLVAVVVLLTGVHGYQARLVYRETLNRQEGEKDLTATLAKLVGAIGKEQNALNLTLRERVQLGALIEHRLSHAAVLAKLAEIMNDQTWLQQFAFDTARDGKFHLVMMGFSSSPATLGTFIQRLSGEPMFRLVVLKSAQEVEDKSSGSAPVQFQIECDIAGEVP